MQKFGICICNTHTLYLGMSSLTHSHCTCTNVVVLPFNRTNVGRIPSSPSVFTSAEYRAWMTRAPSTSAIYERLKSTRDSEGLLQAQKAAKFTYSAENLSILDRGRQVIFVNFIYIVQRQYWFIDFNWGESL